MNITAFIIILVSLLSTANLGYVQAVAAQLKPLRVSYSALSASMSPLWVGAENKIFEKHGLPVSPIFVEGGGRTVAALLSGDISVSVVGAGSPIAAKMRGGDSVILAGVYNTMPYSLVVAPSVKTTRDLIGRKIGVGNFGSSADVAIRLALQHLGLTPVKEVPILQVGTGSTRVAALQSGAIQGTVVEPDNLPVIKRLGFTVLLDLSTLGLDYQHVVVTSTKEFVNPNPAIVDAFVRGWADTIRFYKNNNNKEAVKKAIAKYSKIKDPEDLEFLYLSYAPLLPFPPYPTKRGITTIVETIRQTNPQLREFSPDEFIDERWLRKLEGEGFFRK